MNATNDGKTVVRGLEGVVAAETRISFVDGVNAQLYYSGYNIHDIAEKISYEETVWLLWYNELPTKAQLEEFRSEVVAEMRLPSQVIKLIELTPPSAPPMDVLSTMVSALALFDPDAGDNSEQANHNKSMRLIAQIPTIIANLYRVRTGKPVLSPDPRMNMASNFLYMIHGRKPDELEARTMDLLLLLHADHGLNSSTFAARVTASTHADMHAAVASAINTLKGPMHGGANQRVMKMLHSIDNIHMVEDYIEGMLANDQKIMGFGHRVYKKEDPRARFLRRASEKLCHQTGKKHLYEISHKIERVVKRAKKIYPNVDFYSATVQDALGIPEEFFTTVFAASRISGWVAHILEQFADNRLIRPTSRYIGEYARPFIPLSRRRRKDSQKKQIKE